MGRFDGKVAIVTGGGSGMGAAFAKQLVAEGASVVIGGRTEEKVKKIAAEIGHNILAVKMDASKAEDWTAAMAAAHDAFGKVSILINSAGISDLTPLEYLDEQGLRRSLDINLMSQFHGMKAVLEDMKELNWGRIVNIASLAAQTASGDSPAYATSKHAVAGLSKSAAHAFAKYNVLVNFVLPGSIDTPMMDGVKAMAPEAIAQICAATPLKRMADPEEVATLVLYLASPENTYITGTGIVIDGGMTA